MSPDLQAVLDFLARTDLDGHRGGPTLVWSVLTGIAALVIGWAFVVAWYALVRGPRQTTRVSVRPAVNPPRTMTPDPTKEPTP